MWREMGKGRKEERSQREEKVRVGEEGRGQTFPFIANEPRCGEAGTVLQIRRINQATETHKPQLTHHG